MKNWKRWLGPGLLLAGAAILCFAPPWAVPYAYLPAMLFQAYDWGHFRGWMEGFKRCDQINRPFMELDHKRILAMAEKLAQKGEEGH